MKRTLLLLLALLCMLPAAHAAGTETLYPIAYCFRETDFRADTLSDLNGIFVTSVPEADVATVCLGERVIRAGDVLPVSVLGKLELLPVSTGGQEAALCYCPIRGTALGEPAQVTIRIRSAKDAAPKADDAELETYKNIPKDRSTQRRLPRFSFARIVSVSSRFRRAARSSCRKTAASSTPPPRIRSARTASPLRSRMPPETSPTLQRSVSRSKSRRNAAPLLILRAVWISLKPCGRPRPG